MNRLCFIALSIISLTSFFGHAQAGRDLNEQPQVPILDRKVRSDIDISSTDTLSLFSGSLHSVKSPGGIVVLSTGDKSDFEPASLSLRDVLDSVLKVEPGYLWTVENGVINLTPAIGFAALLDVRISEFKVDDLTVTGSLEALKELPEVKNRLESLGLNDFRLEVWCGPIDLNPPPPKRFSIYLQNATVKEILNAIVREHGRAIWSFHEWQDWPEKGKKYFWLRISDD